MAQQKALFLETPVNGEFRIGIKPVPKPGPGELLVKIHATALNLLDWKIRAFNIYVKSYPAIFGLGAAETVEDIGEGVKGFEKDDRVLHQGYPVLEDSATFQQYAHVPVGITGKISPNVSFEEAASIPTFLVTTAIGLYPDKPPGLPKFVAPWEEGGKGAYKDQPIVIFGGSSFVGQFVMQLAKLFSPIITTASRHNKEFLLSLGATTIVDRSDGHPGGSLALVTQPRVDREKYKDKSVVYIGITVWFPENRSFGVRLFSKLSGLLEDGSIIKANPVEILPGGLAGIPDGLECMKSGQVSGKKLVARPQETE